MAHTEMLRALTILIVALTAWMLVLTVGSYRHDIRQAHERISVGRELAQTPCGPIEYAVAGDGPPVLVVHGAGGGFDQGLEFGAALARNGLCVIAMSRFGYLGTPLPPDASAAAQADAHACLLDALGFERAAIVGGSAGAPSSLQFALRHPHRTTALALVVPATYAPRADDAPAIHTRPATQLLFDTVLRSDFVYWAVTRLARDLVIHALFATPPQVVKSADADEQARVERLIDAILPVSARRSGLLNDAAVVLAIPRYEFERIATPTLAISVADDMFGTYDSARYAAEHIPGARFIGYASGGHLWVGHHREMMSELAQFLKSHTPAPSTAASKATCGMPDGTPG
jgi:pimeloyl-ACP methyl ester carboxylesterase